MKDVLLEEGGGLAVELEDVVGLQVNYYQTNESLVPLFVV